MEWEDGGALMLRLMVLFVEANFGKFPSIIERNQDAIWFHGMLLSPKSFSLESELPTSLVRVEINRPGV